ncbi:hypothetical protein GDO78_001537 [Eleutherodactylus coqui]|uniref:Uncharacterized protein n=1 Tax=Eleutherodactylus coqui TaxID=57060 RepID=A0A8J6KH71_ELECQ|nr:hypothetical protein GDO78_001537 [Eleutherodactylus coqui]
MGQDLILQSGPLFLWAIRGEERQSPWALQCSAILVVCGKAQLLELKVEFPFQGHYGEPLCPESGKEGGVCSPKSIVLFDVPSVKIGPGVCSSIAPQEPWLAKKSVSVFGPVFSALLWIIA